MATAKAEEHASLPDLPTGDQGIAAGSYKVEHDEDLSVLAKDAAIAAKLWFKSPPLTKQLLDHLSSVQLFADSHDQGKSDSDSDKEGLWTWLELAILENDHSDEPVRQGNIELVWRSHRNSPISENWSWNDGKVFSTDSDLLPLLEEGNCIGVRACARFKDWELSVRKGLLVFQVSKNIVKLGPARDYEKIVTHASTIQIALDAVNDISGVPKTQKPALPAVVFSRADAISKSDADKPLRVLSLDGGGVRGYSTLLILKEVMKQAAPGKKPHEVFDLIGGTSTGGLIAIMLGRLKMTVDEVISAYKDVMGKVFTNKASLLVLGIRGFSYSSQPLEEAIQQIVKSRGEKKDVLLNIDDPIKPPKDGCKVFVLAVRSAGIGNRAPVFLRSYVNPAKQSDLPGVLLWQAARATSAAPSYFAPQKVGNIELVDGGLLANNPLGWLWTEVATVFGASRSTDCFLSIGTGMPPNDTLGSATVLNAKAFAGGIVSAATNSESTNILFSTLLDAYAPKSGQAKYFRLNFVEVDPETSTKELDDFVKLAEMDDPSEKALNWQKEKTDEWLALNKALIAKAAAALKLSLG